MCERVMDSSNRTLAHTCAIAVTGVGGRIFGAKTAKGKVPPELLKKLEATPEGTFPPPFFLNTHTHTHTHTHTL